MATSAVKTAAELAVKEAAPAFVTVVRAAEDVTAPAEALEARSLLATYVQAVVFVVVEAAVQVAIQYQARSPDARAVVAVVPMIVNLSHTFEVLGVQAMEVMSMTAA